MDDDGNALDEFLRTQKLLKSTIEEGSPSRSTRTASQILRIANQSTVGESIDYRSSSQVEAFENQIYKPRYQMLTKEEIEEQEEQSQLFD